MGLKSGYQAGIAWIRECRWTIAAKAGKSVAANGLVLSLDKSSSTSAPRASSQFTFATRRQNVVYAGDIVRKNDWKLRP